MGAIVNGPEAIEYPLGDRISLLACYAGLEIEEWSAGTETSFGVLKRLINSMTKGMDPVEVEGVSDMIPSDPGMGVMMSWAIKETRPSNAPRSFKQLLEQSGDIIERLKQTSRLSGIECTNKAEAKKQVSFCFTLSRKAEAFEDALLQFGI